MSVKHVLKEAEVGTSRYGLSCDGRTTVTLRFDRALNQLELRDLLDYLSGES